MAKLRVNKIAAVGVSTENTGSVFFDGSGDYLAMQDSDDFNFGSEDFTVEAWIEGANLASRTNSVVFNQSIGSASSNSAFYFGAGNTGTSLYLSTGGNSWTDYIECATDISDNGWNHIVWQRKGNTLQIYVNGVLETVAAGSASFSGTVYNSSRMVEIGRQSTSGSQFQGHISNLRVCKGHAVYKSNFTPPIRELEVHPETVLLACYDGENIFAEKTGKIIAAYGDRLSSPTPTATDSPIGITTFNPGLTRDVDVTAGPTFEGGVGYNSQNWLTLPKGTTTDRNRIGGRGLIMGGYDGSAINSIEFITISSLGNAQEFGDLTSARFGGGSCGSSTRGLYGGGEPSKTPNDYVTIASTGNSVSFGSLDSGSGYVKACSNQTRGIWGGGRNPNTTSLNVIQYVTIATLGNSQDFGILTSARTGIAAVASPTRGIFSGGYTHPSPTAVNTIDYVTIATTGNALDFGDLLTAVKYSDAVSSGTRGIIGGGANPNTNVMQYVTISTLGDAVNFGDLITAREHISGTDNSIRGVFIGGVTPTILNTIDYMTIASTGDAADFGDLSQTIGYSGSTSDSHGGLS